MGGRDSTGLKSIGSGSGLGNDVPRRFLKRAPETAHARQTPANHGVTNMNRNTFKTRNARRQRGQGMTEYIIIVALIVIAAIGVYSAFGHSVQNQVAGMTSALSGDSAGATAAAQRARGNANTANGVAQGV